MDRFIVSSVAESTREYRSLKSNMDRFIELPSALVAYIALLFKIQYGQIYRVYQKLIVELEKVFKIQYGQIYSACNLNLRNGNRLV